MSDSREQFEAHFPWIKHEARRDGDRYEDRLVQFAWLTWQASRQALELQLLTRYSDHYAPDGISSQSARAHDAAVTACMDLIAQQGIRCRA